MRGHEKKIALLTWRQRNILGRSHNLSEEPEARKGNKVSEDNLKGSTTKNTWGMRV